MVSFKDVAMQAGTILSLKQMRSYLAEWFDGLTEEIVNVDCQDHSKALIIKDNKNQNVFYAPFAEDESINDKSCVFLNGIVSGELRGIIQKCIDLDAQIAAAKNNGQNVIASAPIK